MKNKIIKIELIIIISIYAIINIVFVFFVRPDYSQYENRFLTRFPKITINNYLSGDFNENLANWFSDTIPFRDYFVSLSFKLKEFNGIESEFSLQNVELVEIDNNQVYKEIDKNENNIETKVLNSTVSDAKKVYKNIANNNISTHSNSIMLDISTASEVTLDNQDADLEVFDKNTSLFIVGKGKNARAMAVFSGVSAMDPMYPQTINLYKQFFPNINIYSMVVPTATAYYCPESLQKYTGNQEKFLEKFKSYLSNDIKYVDVYNALLEHKNEYIYLRTDHHWSPLGAYYASEEFAKVAGVKFKDLTNYDKIHVGNFVGSLYRTSKDERLNKYPDDFSYYVPKDTNYVCLQYNYILNHGNIVGKTGISDTAFFKQVSDNGKLRAYLVYMGGDNNTTYLRFGGNNTGRNLLILKDSYGNPVPSFLFYSFDNIIVVDYRYFIDNMINFVAENNITDILFINNVESAMKDIASRHYREFLTQ